MEIVEALRIARAVLSAPDREKLMAHSITAHEAQEAHDVVAALHNVLSDPLSVFPRRGFGSQ